MDGMGVEANAGGGDNGSGFFHKGTGMRITEDRYNELYNPKPDGGLVSQGQATQAPTHTNAPAHHGGGAGGGGHAGGGGATASGTTSVDASREPVLRNTKLNGRRADMVDSHLNRLISKDNAYMRQAADTGLQSANSRGLLNSTIATQAAESARIAAALPIAHQDASTNFSQGINNQNAQNQFALTHLSADYSKELAELQAQTTLQSAEITAGAQIEASRVAGISQIYGTQGLSAEQQENAVTRYNMAINGQKAALYASV